MTKLLYICSVGHSGSTLLDLLIGSLPGFFSTGELQYLPWQLVRNGQPEGGIERQDVCTCLESFRECVAWRGVFNRLKDNTGFDLPENPYDFRLTLLRNQAYRRGAPKQARVFLSLYQRSLVRSPFSVFANLLRFQETASITRNWQLIEAIVESTGNQVVIDSSKDVVRFHMLWSARPRDTHLVVLVRDVFGIAASSIKRGVDPYRSALAWGGFYKDVLKMIKNSSRLSFSLVRYEEMCEQPEEIRQTLARVYGKNDLNDTRILDTRQNHLVFGNSSRYAGAVKIMCDDRWKEIVNDPNLHARLETLRAEMGTVFEELLRRSRDGLTQ